MGHRPLIAVYMQASRPFGVIYIGMTGNLFRRGQEHLDGRASGFARKHSCNMFAWYEEFALVTDAIQREKSLKRWLRPWKMQLIEQTNPDWLDLFPSLCGTAPDPRVKPEDDDVKKWLGELDRKSASEADDPSYKEATSFSIRLAAWSSALAAASSSPPPVWRAAARMS